MRKNYFLVVWFIYLLLKLKELPTERLESSWGALWFGIRTCFGGNRMERRLPGAWLVENGSSNDGFLIENARVLVENGGFDDCFLKKVVVLMNFSWKRHYFDDFWHIRHNLENFSRIRHNLDDFGMQKSSFWWTLCAKVVKMVTSSRKSSKDHDFCGFLIRKVSDTHTRFLIGWKSRQNSVREKSYQATVGYGKQLWK